MFFYSFSLITTQQLLAFFPSTILISTIGYLDDHKNIKARWRLIAQVFAAIFSLTVLGGFHEIQLGPWNVHLGWSGSVLAVIALIWSTNLYNFMDGIDGIAATETLFVFGGGGYFIWHSGGYYLAWLTWAMAAIVAGFFLWNRPPAKIFMGDAGSSMLGFLVVLLALAGKAFYNTPILPWLILYSLFWFDTTITLLRRVLRREKCYEAHRLHAYQRLQDRGWSHKQILVKTTTLNFLLLLIAVLANLFPNYSLLMLISAVTMLLIIYIIVEKLQPMYTPHKS